MHEKVQQEQFRIGLEVSFRVILDENTRKHVAIEIELAEPGALAAAMHHTGVDVLADVPVCALPLLTSKQ